MDVVKAYTAPVIHLLDHLDLILRHGLKERYRLFEASTEPPTYWAFVAKKTFPRNVDYIQSLVGSRAGLDRGRAWLALALSESALQTYFQQFADDHKLARSVARMRPHAHAQTRTHGRPAPCFLLRCRPPHLPTRRLGRLDPATTTRRMRCSWTRAGCRSSRRSSAT